MTTPHKTTPHNLTQKLNVREFFKDKVVLITGATGFVGKVIVEKILWDLPNVKKIYILIRTRKKKLTLNARDRLKKEIFDSPIMDRLKKRHGNNFTEFIQSKVDALSGDVTNDNLFDDPESRELAKSTVNVIIHSAATIGFQERLDNSINLNIFGTLRMIQLAKECKHLNSFVHISTCYANAPRRGTVEEKIYPLELPKGEDVEDFCNRVMTMKPQDIQKLTDKILPKLGFPNTYTFTKNMTEQLIIRKRGNLPLVICRPSIVSCSLKEPYAGWVDAVSASGSVYLAAGLGVATILTGNHEIISDQIPVDYVSNAILILAAWVAGKNILKVFHVGSSSRNPCTWGMSVDGIMRYWHSHRPKAAIARADFEMIPNTWKYNWRFFTEYTTISRAYYAFATIIRSKFHSERAMGLFKIEYQTKKLSDLFRFFTLNEWVFDTRDLEQVVAGLSDEEKKIFYMDTKLIDWIPYFQFFCYGLHRWVLKENPTPPTVTKSDLVKKDTTRIFSDITFAIDSPSDFSTGEFAQSLEEMKESVLYSTRVQNAIQQVALQQSLTFGEVEDKALQIMDTMFANPKRPVVKALGWLFRKIWRKMYHAIVVDDDEIEKIREIAEDPSSGPLILMPTHRSYIDFLITSYIFLAYKLPLPHIAAGEDFLNMFIVRNIFRYSGAFFIRRQFGDDPLYRAIFIEYVQTLLQEGYAMEFFTEGTRSRIGTTLQPKMGLLAIIAGAFLERKVGNMTIVPIHISYEKLLEGAAYSSELLGEDKKKESLINLLKARHVLNKKYGDIHVKFAKPINMKQYTEDIISEQSYYKKFDPFINEKDQKYLIRRLAYQVTHELNQTSICMPTAIVSTILLAYRQGISRDELVAKLNWLQEQVKIRGGALHMQFKEQSASALLDRSLKLMSDLVRLKKDMVEIKLSGKQLRDTKRILEMSIYRNQLVYLFVYEGIISCALESFKQESTHSAGADKDMLIKEAKDLAKLFELEYITRPNPDTEIDFEKELNKMIKRGILSVDKNTGKITPSVRSEMHYFLCSMFWPVIESYWLAATSLFSIQFTSMSEDKEVQPTKVNSLVLRAQWLAEKLYKENKCFFYESCSKVTLKNAFTLFTKWGVLERVYPKASPKGKSKIKIEPNTEYVKLAAKYESVDALVGFVGEIGKFKKMEKVTHGLRRMGQVIDFPIQARL